jgi:hypothetical protein
MSEKLYIELSRQIAQIQLWYLVKSAFISCVCPYKKVCMTSKILEFSPKSNLVENLINKVTLGTTSASGKCSK